METELIKIVFTRLENDFTKYRLSIPVQQIISNPFFFLRYTIDVSATYEDVIRILIANYMLPSLTNSQLRYKVSLNTISVSGAVQQRGVDFHERQALASLHVLTPLTDQIILHISTEKVTSSPSKHPTAETTVGLGQTISAVATAAANIFMYTAKLATIIQALIVVQERWEKTHPTSKSGSPSRSQPKPTDIYAVRLRMTDGREKSMQKWLTEPDELKHFIDVFNQPSSKVKPTEVVFVLWNRETIIVDVTQGAQGNLQLDEMLKYLKVDSA